MSLNSTENNNQNDRAIENETDMISENLNIHREVFTFSKFVQSHHVASDTDKINLLASIKVNLIKNCKPSKLCAKKQLFNRLPGLKMLKNYPVKEYFLADLLAGAIVGFMHLPQGMAYALLATLPPIYGLYTSFYPSLIYWIFGTSRHISIGTFSVVSLMAGSVITDLEKKYVPPLGFNRTQYELDLKNKNQTTDATYFLSDNPEQARVMIAMTNAFLVGLIQIFMFIFQFGFLTSFFSEPFNLGFITGCAVHVFTSQVKLIFGISLSTHVGIFKIPKV
jgi:MFS superfamily sulfate permease-like transporter